MAPVFNQALKAGHVGFVTDTYIQCISSSLYSLTNILADDNLGVFFFPHTNQITAISSQHPIMAQYRPASETPVA